MDQLIDDVGAASWGPFLYSDAIIGYEASPISFANANLNPDAAPSLRGKRVLGRIHDEFGDDQTKQFAFFDRQKAVDDECLATQTQRRQDGSTQQLTKRLKIGFDQNFTVADIPCEEAMKISDCHGLLFMTA
jgi:hypothetical protein